MSSSHHLCMSVRGALRGSFDPDDNTWRSATHSSGPKAGLHMSRYEYQEELMDWLAKGWDVLPMGDCTNFDKKEGCCGHVATEPPASCGHSKYSNQCFECSRF